MALFHSILATVNRIENSVCQLLWLIAAFVLRNPMPYGSMSYATFAEGSSAVKRLKNTAVEKEGPLELLQFIQKCNLGNSVPNIVIILWIVLTIAVSVATCERSLSKLNMIKNYLRSSMSTLWLRNLATLSM